MPFKKGQSGNQRGRKPGSTNKVTGELKAAILRAGELSGFDKKGKDGLVGYLTRVANEDVKAFSGLLGRVLPLQVQSDPDQPLIPSAITFVIDRQPDSGNRT